MEIRISLRLTHLVALTLLLSLFPILTNDLPSAFACKKPPASPISLTSWARTGGPAIKLTVAPTGELPTHFLWATSLYNKINKKWEPWSAWKKFTITKNRKNLTYQSKLTSKYSQISFVSYAGNTCGRSGTIQLRVPLKSSSQLTLLPPQIASSLPLSLSSISLNYFDPDYLGIPILVTSQTPSICTTDLTKNVLSLLAPGSCKIRLSENSKLVSTPSPDIFFQFNILKNPVVLPETTQDRPDDIQGFQIHVVYVTLRDAPSGDLYNSGEINNWVALAQEWLYEKIGKRLIFDTYQNSLDVSTLRSHYLTSDLANDGNVKEIIDGNTVVSPLPKLANEFNQANGGSKVGKNLLFIVDAHLGPKYCGWGQMPGSLALAYLGEDGCWQGISSYLGVERKINPMSNTIIHELIHNFGVDHVCIDQTDIMIGNTCPEGLIRKGAITIDATHTRYLGGSLSGANILSLKVWSDGSGVKHIPLRDVCYMGELCLLPTNHWSDNAQLLDLQESIAGNWATLASFTSYRDPNPPGIYPYTYDVKLMPISIGVHTYRYRLQPTTGWNEYLDTPFVITVPY
ncbi:MAG TPA: hypothetical protein VMW30_10200 [Candidatus Paceibacterota bacterium]|nr:hypothetical protein [Candidatus Paceibacterota bacterium]